MMNLVCVELLFNRACDMRWRPAPSFTAKSLSQLQMVDGCDQTLFLQANRRVDES